MAFLARNPYLTATVCDRAAALAVARKIAKRLNTKENDRRTWRSIYERCVARAVRCRLSIPTCCISIPQKKTEHCSGECMRPSSPVAALSSRMHFFRILRVISTRGQSFAVSMLLFTERGNTYSRRETVEWLREAGFVKIRPMRAKKGSEDWDGGSWRLFVRLKGQCVTPAEDHDEEIQRLLPAVRMTIVVRGRSD